MLKKYVPMIMLLCAGTLLWWVLSHQRGRDHRQPTDLTIPATSSPFSRNVASISYSKHARCRMECRHIDESEVKEILSGGTINYDKIEADSRGRTYPLEGMTHDRQHVRIVFAPKENAVVVVTVIDLDKEWPCDCK